MKTTVFKEILAFLLGRKYYANVVFTIGTTKQEICGPIFPDKESAERHRVKLDETVTFEFIETISFRSRQIDFTSIIKS